jgi:hypothetical protein
MTFQTKSAPPVAHEKKQPVRSSLRPRASLQPSAFGPEPEGRRPGGGAPSAEAWGPERTGIRQTFSTLDDNVLLTEAEVAEVGGLSAQTLRRWRRDAPHKVPTQTRMHGMVRYRVKAVRDWLDSLAPSAA